MSDNVSGVPRLAWRLSVVAAAAFILGPLGAHFGLTKPLTGLAVFALGGVLSLTSAVLGIIGALRHSGEARSAALRGLGIGGLCSIIFISLLARGRSVPRINDITTDTDRPPKFVAALKAPQNADRDMTYPGPSFADQQKRGYPDIAPLLLPIPPSVAYAKALDAAKQTPNWVLTRDDAAALALEGTDTSQLFRFQDDFVIEIREDVGGSVVEMRSKSRDGQGDFGVNAARIRGFFAKLK